MQEGECMFCGAKFPMPQKRNKRFCSDKCAKADWRRRRRMGMGNLRHYAPTTPEPVSLSTLMTSPVKPANTSAVRWRIELARRANPGRYACAEIM